MKRLGCWLVAVAALALLVETVAAQPDEKPRERGAGHEGRRGGRQGFGRGRRFPPPPLMVALDKDKDGVLSAKEIDNAVAALKTLDKNKDGKLTQDELRRPRRFGGRGFGGRGGRGGDFIARIMANDKNKDGKVSKDEAPERMKDFFDRIDSNGDGFIDKKELEEMSRRFGRGRGRGRQGDSLKKKQRPESDK